MGEQKWRIFDRDMGMVAVEGTEEGVRWAYRQAGPDERKDLVVVAPGEPLPERRPDGLWKLLADFTEATDE